MHMLRRGKEGLLGVTARKKAAHNTRGSRCLDGKERNAKRYLRIRFDIFISMTPPANWGGAANW